MKKNLKLLSIFMAITALAGCNNGEMPHEHTFKTEFAHDDTNHWHEASCEHTDLISGLHAHNFSDDNICDDCGYEKPAPIVPHEHTFASEWSKDETNHWYQATCEHTDLTKDLVAHNFGNDNVCDECGYVKEISQPIHEHTFDETNWEKDSEKHWHKATCEHTDLVKDMAAHNFGYDNICDDCGYVKPTPETPHEHTFATTWKNDETNHWHEATCEHTELVSGLAAHNFGGDNVCDDCGFTKVTPEPPHEHTFKAEYSFDESNHWHEATCEHKDLFSGLSAHNFGDDDVCDDCGYTKPAPAHEHTFDTEWSKDETNHWRASTCEHTGLTIEFGAHEYGDDNVCDVCGYELIIKEKYVVYFASNGGSNVQPELVEHGEKASMPEDPTKENYVFLGWYKSQEYTGIAYDFEEEITENTTLYALWGARISYVNYDGETYKEENVRLNTKIEAPEDPSWGEAHFLGWYESSDFEGTTFDFDLGANKNTTLYARYGYALEFIGVNNKIIASLIQPTDQVLSDPGETSLDYYDFDNYYSDPEYTQLFEFGNKLTKDTKIYLNFIPKTYNISYSFTDGITHTNPTSYVYGVGVETILDPTSFAYSDTKQFCGWYFDDNFTQPATSISKEMHGDITLYAKVVRVVNITYNGWPKTIPNPNPTKVIVGEAFSLDASPLEEIEGISNVKFMVCGEELTSKYLQIDEDMTIDVVFDSQKTTITFDPNEGVFLPKNAFIYIDGPKLAGGKKKVDIPTNNGKFNLYNHNIMEQMVSVEGTNAIFEGFYFDSEFENPLSTSSMDVNKIGNGSTIYAKFEETPNENIPYETYGNWSDLSGGTNYRTFTYDLEVPKGVKTINISYKVNASGTHQLWLYDLITHERDPINEWHGAGTFEVNESINVEGKTQLRLQYQYSGDQLSFHTYFLSVDPEFYDRCNVQCVSSSIPITSECNYYHVPEIPYTGLEREYYTFDGWVDSNNNKVDLTSDWLISEEEATLKASWIYSGHNTFKHQIDHYCAKCHELLNNNDLDITQNEKNYATESLADAYIEALGNFEKDPNNGYEYDLNQYNLAIVKMNNAMWDKLGSLYKDKLTTTYSDLADSYSYLGEAFLADLEEALNAGIDELVLLNDNPFGYHDSYKKTLNNLYGVVSMYNI